jgi:hypothetical protein
MRIESLYGVIPGGQRTGGEQLAILPSKDLYRELISLPRGSKVGIEYTPEFTNGVIVNDSCVDASGGKYWTRLERVLKGSGMEVVYLEDYETWAKYAQQDTEVHQLRSELTCKIPEIIEGESDGKEAMSLARKLYRATAKRDYLQIVGREKKIVEKIKETSPRAVVLSQGTADFLFSNGESSGLEFQTYGTEEIFWFVDPTQPAFKPEFLDDGWRKQSHHIDSQRDKLGREFIKRRYNAVQKGRIIDDPANPPMFRGTWDSDIPEQGLFEMYLDPEYGAYSLIENGDSSLTIPSKPTVIGGKIEDCLGTAVFSARVSGDSITFSKTYDPEVSSSEAAQQTLHYKATKCGDTEYQGAFTFGKFGVEFPFRMQKIS